MRWIALLILVAGCEAGGGAAEDAGPADARTPACPIVSGIDECSQRRLDTGASCFVCHGGGAPSAGCFFADGDYCVVGGACDADPACG